MQQVTIEWLDLNGKKHTNKIAIPAGHINLSRIDDWFRAGNLNVMENLKPASKLMLVRVR